MRQRLGGDSAETKLMQIALTLRGWTVTDLARKARLTRNYTSLTVHGHRGSEAARRRIAKVLGMDMERAFPESGTRTGKDGHRLTRTSGKERK